MPRIAAVNPARLHPAFLEAFADYAMDASGTTEERLLLRMRKNAVDYEISPGLYDGDRLVGFTLIGIDEWGGRLTAYDAGTGIVPEFRKLGWARKLFDHALPALQERGVTRFALEVLQQNGPAIKAYRKSGFEIARELRCFAAKAEDLVTSEDRSTYEIREVHRAALSKLESSADWLPSFENRFSTVDAIPDYIELTGVFLEGALAGVCAYSPALNWLLSLVVGREHRRLGIGTALLKNVASAMSEGTTRLPILNIDGEDTGTQAFLESLGFKPLVEQYEMLRDI